MHDEWGGAQPSTFASMVRSTRCMPVLFQNRLPNRRPPAEQQRRAGSEVRSLVSSRQGDTSSQGSSVSTWRGGESREVGDVRDGPAEQEQSVSTCWEEIEGGGARGGKSAARGAVIAPGETGVGGWGRPQINACIRPSR